VDAFEAVLSRRSVRKFADEPVSDHDVERVVRAAMSAPSAFNEQPCHFVIVRDERMKRRLSGISEFSKPMAGAQVGIVVCGDTDALRKPGSVYWIIDCAAALENGLIAANACGLGAVWLGIHPTEERIGAVRDLLALPDSIEPLGMIALGWPAEIRPTADRFDPERIHDERW